MDVDYSVDESMYRDSSSGIYFYPIRSLLNLDQDVPALKPFYTSLESNFIAAEVMGWNRAHYWMAYLAVFLYMLMVYIGPKLMAKREAFDLRTPLKYWNLFLAIFSLWGASRIVPHLFHLLHTFGFEVSICSPPAYTYGHGAAGLWVLLFIYSKYFELLDTLFIILRKKNLSFLHWYHHATVLLYTWDAYVVEQPAGIYFIAMNFSVHAVMYFYYFLAAQLKRPLSWGIFVTAAQISQMFIGVGLTMLSLHYAFSYPSADHWHVHNVADPLNHGVYISKMNLFGACLMYSTYFYLFAEFFVKRYVMKGTKDRSKKIE